MLRGGALRPALCAAVLRSCAAPLPQTYSPTSDVYNQDVFVEYFSGVYYNDRFAGSLPPAQRDELRALAGLARRQPELALAAAQTLYMFGWYTGAPQPERAPGGAAPRRPAAAPRGHAWEWSSALARRGAAATPGGARGAHGPELAWELDWENIAAAAELFEASLRHAGCADAALSLKAFVEERACDVRWAHALVLHDFLARAYRSVWGDVVRAAEHEVKAHALLRGLLQTPRFRGPCCAHWTSPAHFNFNAVFFPDLPSAAVWSRDPQLSRVQLPIAAFLEESFAEIRAELLPILEVPREEWISRAPGAVNAEHLAGRGRWHMLAIVRHGEWNTILCSVAPRTCELIGSRPEVSGCTLSNSNIMRLSPGGLVKPHFGNAPRLSLHLPLSSPEPEAAVMQVGEELVQWEEGRVVIFDDTYAHHVRHAGRLPRYVLNVWFCHPCDRNPIHDHGQSCIV